MDKRHSLNSPTRKLPTCDFKKKNPNRLRMAKEDSFEQQAHETLEKKYRSNEYHTTRTDSSEY